MRHGARSVPRRRAGTAVAPPAEQQGSTALSPLPDPALPPDTGRFLGGAIGQKLRTPLHSLLGFLELLAEDDLNEDQQRLVEHVMDGADGLLVASDRLQALVRLLADDYKVRSDRPVDLAEVF